MEEFKIRTFGRVKGRKLSQSQNNKLENLLPKFEIKIENDKILNFSTDNKKLIFEIGFGYGEQIANQAILHKDCNLIGCETYVNGVLSLLTKIEENKIENIKIFNNDARLLLEKMPDNSIDVLFVLFPDPWPKKRQNKKRIINPEFLDLVKQKIKKDGILFFASDILNYVEWTYDFAKEKFEPLFEKIEDCKNEPDWWVKTRYQQKAIKEGRESYFLKFKNNK